MITIIERMRREGPFKGAQARVARYLERAYGELPFLSLGEIATASGVGKATVSRFVQRMGYQDFSELKHELRDELYARSVSPAARHARHRDSSDVRARLAEHRRRCVADVDATLAGLDVTAVAALCADLARASRVWVYGQRFSYGIAFNLALHLRQLLADARIVDGGSGTVADGFSGVTPADHVLIVAHARIGRDKLPLARFLAERGVAYSLITDLPEGDDGLCGGARTVLRTCTQGVGAFHDYAASLAAVHALVAALEVAAPTARTRLTEAELALASFDAFVAPVQGGG